MGVCSDPSPEECPVCSCNGNGCPSTRPSSHGLCRFLMYRTEIIFGCQMVALEHCNQCFTSWATAALSLIRGCKANPSAANGLGHMSSTIRDGACH